MSRFIVYLYFPSDCRSGSKPFIVVAYAVFSLVSIVPIFYDYLAPPTDDSCGDWGPEFCRNMIEGMFYYLHLVIINKGIPVLLIVALFLQARQMLLRPEARALSRIGLAAQAVVFAIVAVSWTMRVKVPNDSTGKRSWYDEIGWVVVDNVIFAVAQGLLLCISWRRTATRISKVEEGEREPLVRG